MVQWLRQNLLPPSLVLMPSTPSKKILPNHNRQFGTSGENATCVRSWTVCWLEYNMLCVGKQSFTGKTIRFLKWDFSIVICTLQSALFKQTILLYKKKTPEVLHVIRISGVFVFYEAAYKAYASFLFFCLFHNPAFSRTFIAIFPAQGTAIAADGTGVLISHITQCHTKDDKQKLSHTIPPFIWVVFSWCFYYHTRNSKKTQRIMQKAYGKSQ